MGTSEWLLDEVCVQLETAPTLIDFVHHIDVDKLLRTTDYERFDKRRYNVVPIVRALFCRELADLSWNGLYEYLPPKNRAVRLGFDPTKFGPYNTGPTRQTLTTAWDEGLSERTKRTLLSVREQLVAAAYGNETVLDLRPPRHSMRLRRISGNATSVSSRMSRFGHPSGTLAKPSLGHSTPAVLQIRDTPTVASTNSRP